jgi:hypothetical protein
MANDGKLGFMKTPLSMAQVETSRSQDLRSWIAFVAAQGPANASTDRLVSLAGSVSAVTFVFSTKTPRSRYFN